MSINDYIKAKSQTELLKMALQIERDYIQFDMDDTFISEKTVINNIERELDRRA